VIEEVSTYTEFIIILDKDNIDRAFSVLKKFLWGEKYSADKHNSIKR